MKFILYFQFTSPWPAESQNIAQLSEIRIPGKGGAEYSFCSISLSWCDLCSDSCSLILINRNCCLIFSLKFHCASLFPFWRQLNIPCLSWICMNPGEVFSWNEAGFGLGVAVSRAVPEIWMSFTLFEFLDPVCHGRQIVTIPTRRWRKEAGRVSIAMSPSSESWRNWNPWVSTTVDLLPLLMVR